MTKSFNFTGRLAFKTMFGGVLLSGLLVGCDRQQSANSEPSRASDVVSSDVQESAEPSGPGPGEKVCFECKGTGKVACRADGCDHGMVPCPGNCLRLSRGNWRHMYVAGHSPDELWITFKTAGGTESWNQDHVGEVIVYQNGDAVNLGACKICGGATKVQCPSCKGTGKQTCEVCSGKKYVPIAWTPTDNPYFNSQPDLIRLTDGRVILGHVAASMGAERTIVTRDRKIIHVKASDILPKSETVSSASE